MLTICHIFTTYGQKAIFLKNINSLIKNDSFGMFGSTYIFTVSKNEMHIYASANDDDLRGRQFDIVMIHNSTSISKKELDMILQNLCPTLAKVLLL